MVTHVSSLLLCFLLALSLQIAFSARSVTMMASKYLGKSPVFVAGGSRGTGLEVVRRLSAAGTPVHALVRSAENKEALEKLPGVKALLGDAADPDAVKKCMDGCVAAITTLGGKVGDKRIDYVGNSNVIEQAGILGVERIILVTSVGCGSTKAAVSASVYAVLEEALKEKNKAERDLRLYTNLDWTIIRPGGLKSELATGKAIVTDNHLASGVINRADVADMVVRVLGSTKCTRKELTCIDPSQNSNYGNDEAGDIKAFEL